MIESILGKLNIKYELLEHEAFFTVKDAQVIKDKIEGLGVKNLFLKDQDKNYYLVLIRDDKRVNFKYLENELKIKHLIMASKEELKNILGLEAGSVTPLAIINDLDGKVTIIIDQELENNKILVHPLVNTKTIAIEFRDLIRFIEYYKHDYIIKLM